MAFYREKNILILLCVFLAACSSCGSNVRHSKSHTHLHGAIVRGNTMEKNLALVFTGDEYADGGVHILSVLEGQDVPASFFFTGKFYRNPEFASLIRKLLAKGFYLGAHSDQHLLYCDWEKRDSVLVTRNLFRSDLKNNYMAMAEFGIRQNDAPHFLPPYEWYNDTIAIWTREMGLTLINMSHGTISHADYTLPGSEGYQSSKAIYDSILEYETSSENGLNGFVLLSHIGSSTERTDKFYLYLDDLITELKYRGYAFNRIDSLLSS